MYSMPGDEDCPVKHFKKYCSKLKNNLDAFYQRPKDKWSHDDAEWYVNAPLGKNKLGDLMKSMSIDGGLSQVYTNHCLRATCATVLHDAGFLEA